MSKIIEVTINPKIFSGQAAIRGMRITAAFVLELIASGMTYKEILKSYPELEKNDLL